MRLATCAMVLNNTSWQTSKSPCPFAGIDQPDMLLPDTNASVPESAENRSDSQLVRIADLEERH
ncbi:MAG: hypothetical protein ABJJ37_25340 [Roseibium sp.]